MNQVNFKSAVSQFIKADNALNDAASLLCQTICKALAPKGKEKATHYAAFKAMFAPAKGDTTPAARVYSEVFQCFAVEKLGTDRAAALLVDHPRGSEESKAASLDRSVIGAYMARVRASLYSRMDSKQKALADKIGGSKGAKKGAKVTKGTKGTKESNDHLSGESGLKTEHEKKDALSAESLKKKLLDLITDISASNADTVKQNRVKILELLNSAEDLI